MELYKVLTLFEETTKAEIIIWDKEKQSSFHCFAGRIKDIPYWSTLVDGKRDCLRVRNGVLEIVIPSEIVHYGR